jgi:hypothetical protein
MLEIARRRGIAKTVAQADLQALSLEGRFDLIVSLFGTFGYLPDRDALRAAMAGLARHLDSRGNMLIEPPLFAEDFKPPKENVTSTRFGDGTLTRTACAQRSGDALEIEFEWTYRPDHLGETRTVIEVHRMLLLPSVVWLQEAREGLGEHFQVSLEGDGPIGRGLLRAFRKDDANDSD